MSEPKSLYEHAAIIAPRESWDGFFAFREKNPEVDFHLFTLEGLEEMFSCRHDDRAVIELLKRGYSYPLAVDTLKALAFLGKGPYKSARLGSLIPLRDELMGQGLLWREPNPEKSFLGHNVIIHGYADVTRVSKALSELSDMSVSFDLPAGNVPLPHTIHRFPNIYEELHYVLNQIAAALGSGVRPETIYLAGCDGDYEYLLGEFAARYGFPVEPFRVPALAETAAYLAFRQTFSASGFEAACRVLEGDDPDGAAILELARRYALPMLGKEKQIEIYDGLFKAKPGKAIKAANAIRILRGYHVPEGSHVYFLNFSLGSAPAAHHDDDFLSDGEKSELMQPTSGEENAQEHAELLSLLDSGMVDLLSFQTNSVSGRHFLPAVAEERKYAIDDANELNCEYSHAKGMYLEAALLDRRRDELFVDPRLSSYMAASPIAYRTYSYAFTPFPLVAADAPMKYSYSGLTRFYECAFAFYLSRFLDLKDDEANFTAKLGSVYHEVLQHLYDGSFDFESAWAAAVADVAAQEGGFTPKDRVLMLRLHDELIAVIAFLREHEGKMASPRFLTERDFSYPLSKLITLVGRIDKAVVTKDEGGEYLSLIDYKTGSADFDESLVQFGLSLQLPLYAYVALHDETYQGAELIGLFIDHILANRLVRPSGKTPDGFYASQLLLKGLYISDVAKLATFEPFYSQSSFISGLSYSPDKGFKSNNRSVKTRGQLIALSELAAQKAIDADRRIRQSDFAIDPKRYKSKVDSCRYCPFRDVCHRDDGALVYLRAQEEDGDE